MNNYIMYIVINKDLGMSHGKTAAQAGHAVTEYLISAFRNNDKDELEKIDAWHKDCQKKIILGAHENVMQKLASKEGAFAVHDLGYTEIAPNSLTSVCLGIFDKEQVPKEIKRLQLL